MYVRIEILLAVIKFITFRKMSNGSVEGSFLLNFYMKLYEAV